MIYLEINGEKFENFVNISVSRQFDAVPASFSFEATTSADETLAYPISIGDSCRILIDETPIITGFINDLSLSHSLSRHSISIRGASKISDLVDSTMDNSYIFEFRKGTRLKEALEAIVAKTGVTSAIIDDVYLIFTQDEKIEGKIGNSVWSLLCEFAIKYQALLGETGNGDIFLTRGGGDTIAFPLIKRVNDINNNLLKSSMTRSHRKRFHKYAIFSQTDSTGLGQEGEAPTQGVSNQGISQDNAIRTTRFNCTMAEQSSDSTMCETRAEWQSNMSRVDSFAYNCTYQGYKTPNGIVIEPGFIVHVTDQYMQIDADLLIKKVNYSYSLSGGSIVEMGLVLPDAFTLTTSQPTKTESGNDFSGIFKFDDDET